MREKLPAAPPEEPVPVVPPEEPPRPADRHAWDDLFDELSRGKS